MEEIIRREIGWNILLPFMVLFLGGFFVIAVLCCIVKVSLSDHKKGSPGDDAQLLPKVTIEVKESIDNRSVSETGNNPHSSVSSPKDVHSITIDIDSSTTTPDPSYFYSDELIVPSKSKVTPVRVLEENSDKLNSSTLQDKTPKYVLSTARNTKPANSPTAHDSKSKDISSSVRETKPFHSLAFSRTRVAVLPFTQRVEFATRASSKHMLITRF
ncbi:hypothetical protein SK128_011533 [Halocaridina rubra]|uniref:Uncharacterized protein n=1 Tax=Halocaridina rubra TaxID=373956 RepID=A0AAN8XTI9_HALRR